MAVLIGVGLWVLFSLAVAIGARRVAIIFAKRRGWTDTTMPLKYYIWFFIAYSVIVYAVPAILVWIFG
jgi:hypothetical protein